MSVSVGAELVAQIVLICFCLAVMVTDWLRRRIYNWLTYPAMALGLILAALQAFPGEIGRVGFLDHLFATIVVFALAWPLLVMKLRGRSLMMAGDAKLLMAIGALMGSTFLLWAFAWGSIIGGVAAVVFIVVGLARGRTLMQALQSYLPYGVYLSAGALVTLFSGIPR